MSKGEQLKFDFTTPYNGKNMKVSLYCPEPSLTEQIYKDECDIDFIIKNFVKTGELPQSTMSFVDCTTVQDFQDAQYLVAECKSNFEQLPAVERDRFKTVENYLSFISDPKNLKESYEKGYIDRNTVDLKDVYPEQYAAVTSSNVDNSTVSQTSGAPDVNVKETSTPAEVS